MHQTRTHTHKHTKYRQRSKHKTIASNLAAVNQSACEISVLSKSVLSYPIGFPRDRKYERSRVQAVAGVIVQFFLVEAMKNQTLRANKIEKIENNVSLSLWGMDFKICSCRACPFSFPYACLVTRSLVQNESVTSVEFAAQSLRCCL